MARSFTKPAGKKAPGKNATQQQAVSGKGVKKKPVQNAAAKVKSRRVEKALTGAASGSSRAVASSGDPLTVLVKKGIKKPFFTRIQPMLATPVDKAFDDKGWIYEVKWDGYRAIAFMNKSKISLKSRNDKSFNDKFYPLFQSLKNWDVNAIVDGEIVVVGENGQANFGALQNWRSEADGILQYYVFDLLWYNGYDLQQLELTDRRAILRELIPPQSLIKLSRDFVTSGIEFLKTARKMGLEGIMAKKKDSPYYAGERTREWLKIKANKRQEVVIGGYTRNAGSSKPFSALLVGVFENSAFIYTGKIGTGFNIKMQKEMLVQFKPLIIDHPAFVNEPDINKPSRFRPNPPKATATWIKPILICEVSYAEITPDGVMRHPSFEGMREDKEAEEVVMETEEKTKNIVGDAGRTKFIHPVAAALRGSLLNPKDETQVRKAGGHELKFTNLSKMFWPKEKLTKRDLINYYYQAAPFILPYLKDRPQALNRFPNGINGMSFYQKDVTGKVPDWMDTYAYHSEGDGEDKQYLLGNNEATLLFLANQACIEMNPWSSTTKKPDHPTWCMIDLDPDKNTFEQVIEAARVVHRILEALGVPSYPKTSGSTGLHIYIPLGGKYTYEQSKEFARIVVTLVHRQLPEFTSLERTVKNRRGKMYLDFLQNRPHATIAAPYSVRPRPGATVSMPLHWEEVKKGLKMTDFTLHNAIARMREEGDIFKPILGKGIDLKKVIKAAAAFNAR
jgi:bifunctional non-homologous end joining protein LigD